MLVLSQDKIVSASLFTCIFTSKLVGRGVRDAVNNTLGLSLGSLVTQRGFCDLIWKVTQQE